MKRSFLYTALVLGTMVIATGSRTFGDSKNRMGSGGFNRSQGNNNHQNNNHQNNNHQNNNTRTTTTAGRPSVHSAVGSEI